MLYQTWLPKKQMKILKKVQSEILMGKLIEEIDVIAQFKHDGEIIPMRLQMLNSAGQPIAYTIKGYRRLTNKDTYTSVDNIFVTHSTIVFECQIVIDNEMSVVRLYFQPEGHIWLLGID